MIRMDGSAPSKVVFLHEAVTGGVLAGRPLPASWAAEGRAIRAALAAEFAAVPGIRVVATLDDRLADPPGAPWRTLAVEAGEAPAIVSRQAAEAEGTLLIAPESEGQLAALARLVERAGGRSLGPSIEAIELAGDKASLGDRLAGLGIATPPAGSSRRRMACPETCRTPPSSSRSTARGSIDTFLISGPDELPAEAQGMSLALLQPFLPGEPLSASFLVDGSGRARLLGIGAQRVEVRGGRFHYLGGRLPFEESGPIVDLARRAIGAVPGLRGFVGVDLLRDGSTKRTVILEINPRPTTSLVGLLRLWPPGALARAWLAVFSGESEGGGPDPFACSLACPPLIFDADGTVRVDPDRGQAQIDCEVRSSRVGPPHPSPPPQGGRGKELPIGQGFLTPSPLLGEGWGGGSPSTESPRFNRPEPTSPRALPMLDAPSWLGLDVGGANLKAAHSDGSARSVPFALWTQPERLGQALADLADSLSAADRVALTMTAELCDCYPTKAAGVLAVIEAAVEALPARPIFVWGLDGTFHPVEAIRACPALAAAANWLALATLAARLLPDGVPGLLIDVGSTTSDLIPLGCGQPLTRGRTDTERLQAGELVYAGVRRTPVSALATELTWRGMPTGLAAELFASTLDVYLTLGAIPPAPGDRATADGRPATIEAARDRLARMVGADRDGFSAEDAYALAQAADEALMNRMLRAARQACAATIGRPGGAIVSGSGAFLARRLAGLLIEPGGPIVDLEEVWGPIASSAGCAYAVLVLAREGERSGAADPVR